MYDLDTTSVMNHIVGGADGRSVEVFLPRGSYLVWSESGQS